MQGMIDHEKLATGEGGVAKRLGAYFVEELLFLLGVRGCLGLRGTRLCRAATPVETV